MNSSSIDKPLNYWWNNYSKAMFVLSTFYDTKERENMLCFLITLFKMFPNSAVRMLVNDFVMGKSYTVEMCKKAIPHFWKIYPSYLEAMEISISIPYNFLKLCSESPETLFIYIYILQSLVLYAHNKQGHNITLPHYSEMKDMYKLSNDMNKAVWGNPLWFVIHTTALFAPEPMVESFKNYKQLLTCLQHLLPCPKCRFHLSENLTKINLEKCGKTNYDLFKCSYELHNIVNKDTGKQELGFQEALRIYL
jgi:hypothetical protein